ncbi:MAG: dTDP-glucose 4,6-dehydratase [Flavobacteriaceae bacterium]|nr:dTDP-glucose 4,6-dehydratase [Flavobacteriaceae bacterium]|tara:strand:- start:172984 stop:173994 length:1011 start_codon:yes stop_codon:yes gene_type:complete
MKTILVTGGAGFIGSNFVCHFLEGNPDTRIINLDKLTYAGSLDNLRELEGDERHIFVEGDICDKALLTSIFKEYEIEGVIHFAAESHVDNSIDNPDAFIKTNINGTYTLLEVAKKFWMSTPFQYISGKEDSRFHHISTDEVYGSLGAKGYFSEATSYAPNSPYSASKASSDFLVRSYFHTYGLNVVTTNCTNNYGPKQHDEKLIPTVIRKALAGENIPIYGDGKNVRDWLFVKDHCKALETVYKKGKLGETYIIGGNNELNNIDLAIQICNVLDEVNPTEKSYRSQISFVKDRPGHDFRYAVSINKISNELGWTPSEDFSRCLKETVQWYLKKYSV